MKENLIENIDELEQTHYNDWGENLLLSLLVNLQVKNIIK